MEKGKVVNQKLIGTPMMVPAAFNEMQKEFPNAKISVESKTGETVFIESVNEAKFFRLPAKLNAMYELKNAVDYIVSKHENGDDYKPAEMKTIEALIKKIKGTVKSFTDPRDVKGTFYESAVTEGGKINLKADHLSSSEYQKAKKLKAFNANDWVWNSNTSLYDRVGESAVTEDENTIGGLNKMANTDLERIADYADMIKDRMSQGQTLDAWMYSKISDSVKSLNSVHDTMDGNDGVIETVDTLCEATNTDILDLVDNIHKVIKDLKSDKSKDKTKTASLYNDAKLLVNRLHGLVESKLANESTITETKGNKAVSMAQKKLDKVISDLKDNLLKFKGAKTDTDKETFKSEAKRLTKLRKDASNNLEQAIQDAYADVELVVMENYDTDKRKEMAEKGLALPDGSFPIKNLEDLKNAIQAYGRSKDQAAAAKFIAKRAKALGAEDLIPDTEDFQKSLKEDKVTDK